MTFDERAAAMTHEQVVALLVSHEEQRRQIDWFKRQLFGEKSERRIVETDARQLYLGEAGSEQATPEESKVSVAEHQRRRRPQPEEADDSDVRFGDDVPVEEIRIEDLDLEPGEGEVVTEKVTCKLAQKPVSFVVLRYIRQVVKQQDGTLSCPPAPPSVLGKSVADVSPLACLAIDKFRYHLPLYRQHQRLQAAGIRLARSTLTNWIHRTADLLDPIYHAQLDSILKSRVLAMDETPMKAGRRERGKMQTGYFWPVYGDKSEVAFPFSVSRAAGMVRSVLGEYCGVLLSDGYRAYEKHAAEVNGLVHAQCWSHARRHFVKAEGAEPRLAGQALRLIRDLYDQEAGLRGATDEKRLEGRGEHCKPIVDEFFAWLQAELSERVLLPSNPFTEAANYALERERALRVFLEYPDVPIDTNHLEREIRPIAVARENWLFCWTEVGAQAVGIFQSLLSTCRLQDVDPYTYLVDVLQRVETHPASEVALLTPRLWKERFAANSMRSAVDRVKTVES